MLIKQAFWQKLSVLTCMLSLTSMSYASCGSSLCSINTQLGLQGYSNAQSTHLDLHVEWLDQDQPRSETQDVAVGEISRHHDEVRTINRNTVISLDHAFSERAGISVTLPWRSISHDHIHNHNQGTEHIPEHWDFNQVGDVRALGHYQGVHGIGVLAGLKLPTGSFTVKNDEGELAERTLQPGSGTTDVLFGVFYQQKDIRASHRWFAQALWQEALNTRDDFKSGRTVHLDGGVQYAASPRWALLAQANAVIKASDSGDEAEPEDAGSEMLYLTPGISFSLTPAIQLYAFFQQPIYQKVNGVQLVADSSAVLGIKTHF